MPYIGTYTITYRYYNKKISHKQKKNKKIYKMNNYFNDQPTLFVT